MKKLFTCIFLFLTACRGQTQIVSPTVAVVSTVSTQSPTVTSIPVPIATLENGMQTTAQVEDELCKEAGYLGLSIDIFPNIHHSSSGKWLFAVCEQILDDEITYPFIIFQTNKKVVWAIDARDIASELVDKYSDTMFLPYYWARDEKVLYVNASLPCPDSFECWIYKDGEALYKLDLDEKEISVVLSPYTSSPRFSYAFSISPDEKYIAFVDQSNSSLVHIQDLVSETDWAIELEGDILRAGAIVWSLNSQEIVFSSLFFLDNNFSSSIYLYSISDKSMKPLVSDYSGVLFPNDTKLDENNIAVHWYDQDVLYIETIDQGYWYLNIRTKEFTPEP